MKILCFGRQGLDILICKEVIYSIFVLILSSLINIVKANSNKIRRELVISVLFAIIPLSVLVINGFIFTVYFVGK